LPVANCPWVLLGVVGALNVRAEVLQVILHHIGDVRINANERVSRVEVTVGHEFSVIVYSILVKLVLAIFPDSWFNDRSFEQVVFVKRHVGNCDLPSFERFKFSAVVPLDVSTHVLLVPATNSQMSISRVSDEALEGVSVVHE